MRIEKSKLFEMLKSSPTQMWDNYGMTDSLIQSYEKINPFPQNTVIIRNMPFSNGKTLSFFTSFLNAIFFARKFLFSCTKICIFLHEDIFLHQSFCFFTLNYLFFIPKFLLFLHQHFLHQFFVFLHQNFCFLHENFLCILYNKSFSFYTIFPFY